MAYFDTDCPDGWVQYSAANGKFVKVDENMTVLSEGGANSMTLSIANMPSHNHGIKYVADNPDSNDPTNTFGTGQTSAGGDSRSS